MRSDGRPRIDIPEAPSGHSLPVDSPNPLQGLGAWQQSPAVRFAVPKRGSVTGFLDIHVTLNCWFPRFAVLVLSVGYVVFFRAAFPHDTMALL